MAIDTPPLVDTPLLSIHETGRIYWHSRRGMLELDLVLMPFSKQHYAGLSDADKNAYVQLLRCEDQDMFGWFLQHKKPEDPVIAGIVNLVLEKHHL